MFEVNIHISKIGSTFPFHFIVALADFTNFLEKCGSLRIRHFDYAFQEFWKAKLPRVPVWKAKTGTLGSFGKGQACKFVVRMGKERRTRKVVALILLEAKSQA